MLWVPLWNPQVHVQDSAWIPKPVKEEGFPILFNFYAIGGKYQVDGNENDNKNTLTLAFKGVWTPLKINSLDVKTYPSFSAFA